MATASLLVFLLFCTFNSVLGNSCGGLLEAERGRYRLADSSKQAQPVASSASCLWIIQLHYKTNIRFTLDALSENSHLNLYPEDQLTSGNVNNTHTRLNSTNVGSSLEFSGKTLIVVLSDASASVAFSWKFFGVGINNSSATMKNSDCVRSPNGLLEWEQLESEERVTWAINADSLVHVRWNIDIATSCDAIDSCTCFYFAIFQVNSPGILSEAVKTCGQSSEGQLKGTSGRVVVLIKVNAQAEANKVAVTWGPDEGIVTEPPVTESPVPSATGLFAATEVGLIAINLQTLEATAVTSEQTLTVAVNHNLKKVYRSENDKNSSIVRSNLDGTSREIIVPPTGDYIFMLGIDEASGNLYFALYFSNEIILCNELGKNCAVVISDSYLVELPSGMALDPQNGVLYWGKRGPGTNFLVRANLDGSNVTIISTGFTDLHGITLVQPLNDVLYWVDHTDNIIGTIDTNGGNKRTLLEVESSQRPYGIQVDAHKIYFSNYFGRNIQSVDKNSMQDLTIIFNSTEGVRDLALFNAPIMSF